MASSDESGTAASLESSGSLSGLAVALVSIYFSPEMTGIAPYSSALAQALIDAGSTVHVITGVPHFPTWRAQAPFDHGLRFDEVRGGLTVSRRRHWVPRDASLMGRVAMETSFLAHATPSVLGSRADVVVAVTPSLSGLAAADAGRRGRRLGAIVQDFSGRGASQTGTAGTRVSSAIARLEGRLLRHADRVGVISPDFIEHAIALGVHPDQISVLPNFTHIDRVDTTARDARVKLGWDIDAFTVVHTGNMGLKQGLHHVIAAARQAEERGDRINWVLVGDGNQRRSLERQAKLVRSVRFVAPLAESDYPHALAAADVLLLNENSGVTEFCLPSKLTSYVVAGRPIVAATESGSVTFRTVEQHGLALLVPAGDPTQLLAGLGRIRADRELAARLIQSAASYVPRVARRDAAFRYVEFVQRLANSG